MVYLAEDTTLDRDVALKILDRGITTTSDFELRFRQEARTIAGLNHPNIVHIHALEKIGGELVIDMPFIEGGSLADGERIYQLPAPRVVDITRDILLALACCHDSGIIHRDVKPSNILLASDGRALLTDFGLAKLLTDYQSASLRNSSSSGFFIGTPRYAPPEAWDGQESGPAWDVYSLGMVVYEAISGRPAYDAATPLSLMKQVLERPTPRLEPAAYGISLELGELVSSMLERAPEERPPDAGEALEMLLKTPEARREGSTAESVLKRTHQSVRRAVKHSRNSTPGTFRRWAVVLWGFLVLAAIAGVLAAGLAILDYQRGRRASGEHADSPGGVEFPEATCARPYALYDSLDPTSHVLTSNHLLVIAGSREGTFDWIAFDPLSVWCGNLENAPDGSVVTKGHWAEYADQTARVFRHGALTGQGSWLTRDYELALSLTFACIQDGARTTRSYLMRRSSQPESYAAYARRFESADCAQVLLYNELVPRDLAWVNNIESLLLGPVSGLVSVPSFAESDISPTEKSSVHDPLWQRLFRIAEMVGTETDVSILPSSSVPKRGEMALDYTAEEVIIGLRTEAMLDRPLVSLSLSEHPAIPIANSPRRFAQFEESRLLAHYAVEFGQRINWPCDWKVSHLKEGHRTFSEIVVPLDRFDTNDRPLSGSRWRLCCTVADAARPDDGPVAVWGPSDLNEVEHGVLLIFGAAR